MLIKLILNGNDFKKTLKNRQTAAIALLAVGLTGLGCWFLLVPRGGLSDFAQGFYLGASSGVTAGAILLLWRCRYLLRHPEAMKKAKILETDERQRAIVDGSFRWAGIITFFILVAGLFVALPLDQGVFFALLCVIAVYLAAFLAANRLLEKRL